MIPLNFETFDEDLYAILGVRETATAEQIKLAFRIKAKRLHPDLNAATDTTDEFVRLIEAYHILYDEDQRLIFDTYRTALAAACAPRRPVWRMAGVTVALVVSLGAASAFGYFALRGGAASALIAKLTPIASAPIRMASTKSAPTKSSPANSSLANLPPTNLSSASPAQPRPSRPAGTPGETHESSGRMARTRVATAQISPARDGQPPHPSVARVAAAPPVHPPTMPHVSKTEDDEELAARLADSVDAPFAHARPVPVGLRPVPRDGSRDATSIGPKTQQATAVAAVPAKSGEQHLAPTAAVAPKSAAVGSAPPHPHVVRAKSPSPVRGTRPYTARAKVYPSYPRVEARHEPLERYPMPKWVTAPQPPIDVFPF